jgi:predicted O-linked N-acetylglucosamine transferase (SPINDLY family)
VIREELRSRFAGWGVESGRLEFAGREDLGSYLGRFNGVDVGLDPFPHNGHASTLDALWMGVPVVTLSGGTASGRAGSSLLSAAGLGHLVASGVREYVSAAAGLARDLDGLSGVRMGLRERLAGSALLDGAGFAAELEAAWRGMWQAWCAR